MFSPVAFRRCSRRSLAALVTLCLAVLFAGGPAWGQAVDSSATQSTSTTSATAGFPQPLAIEVGDEATDLFVQFSITDVLLQGKKKSTPIWTRAYGLKRDEGMIPGPSFYLQPGDFLQITLNNILDTDSEDGGFNELLEDFETNVNPTFDADELVSGVHGEINIPHNPNNTNLHVHGLHVDPSIDNVTLIIIPEGDSKENYDPSLWPYIRERIWPYQYRIPKDHMPGTFWYHAHKHGSTSIHVENGMAGALIMRPRKPEDAIVPGLNPADDRVIVLQEIANYGIQQGVAGGPEGIVDLDVDDAKGTSPSGSSATDAEKRKDKPLITVNGEVSPTLTLAPGQLQRWRFINAAANHKSFSYLWLGKEGGTDSSGNTTYLEVPMQLVAIDGITLRQKVAVTASKPIFLGPGNRADVLVEIDEPGTYALFKNFPGDVSLADAKGEPVTSPAQIDKGATNPYLLPEASSSRPDFEAYQRPWLYLDAIPGSPTYGQPTKVAQTVIVPNLRAQSVEAASGARLLDVLFPMTLEESPLGWQPDADLGGGLLDSQLLFTVRVEGDPVTGGPSMPSDAHLARISATGNPEKAPAYARPIEDGDVLQSRTALFDISGIEALIYDPQTKSYKQQLRQFTLNGRQFSLSDSIGDHDAFALIADQPELPETTADGEGEGEKVRLSLGMVESAGLWKNQCWTNPGYYSAVEGGTVTVGTQTTTAHYYAETPSPCTLDARGQASHHRKVPEAGASEAGASEPGGSEKGSDSRAPRLTYEKITGLEDLALVNPLYPGAAEIAGIPGLPVATTAEEWILINNSAAAHPFHIHINPFFVTEVGQISYETFQGGENAWVIRTINPDPKGTAVDTTTLQAPTTPTKLPGTSTMWWVVNNWWDTIVIPPHGYVKFRYWMNIPQQNWDGTKIAENVNRFGSWVYHCHILRHEDRGMMMIVGAQPKEMKQGHGHDGHGQAHQHGPDHVCAHADDPSHVCEHHHGDGGDR